METVPPTSQPLHRSFRLTRPAGAPPLAGRAFLAAWGAYVLLSAVDCVSTVFALTHHLGEANPVAADLYAQGGPAALWGFKFAVLAVMLLLLARLPRRLAVAVAIAFAAVMWFNDASNLGWILHLG